MMTISQLLVFFLVVRIEGSLDQRTCEPIKVIECLDLGYNHTGLPNLAGHHQQSEASYAIESFRTLVSFGCSSQLQFLLCSFYVPMCSEEIPILIGPCRPLCESVQKRCSHILRGFGYNWPPVLNCSLFPPENNDSHMCMEGPPETSPVFQHPSGSHLSLARSQCIHFAQPQLYIHLNSTDRCVPICGTNIGFSSEDKVFAAVWMVIWAIPVFCLCFFISSSFFLDASIYKYPDVAAVHMCIAYMFVALGYLVRLIAGSSGVSCTEDLGTGVSVVVSEAGFNVMCVAVFFLLYFFSSAAGVWWLILCWMWLLEAWKRHSSKDLAKYSPIYMVLGWFLPVGWTLSAFLLKKIQADEITGVCYAGGYTSDDVVHWVLLPQLVFVVFGATIVVLVFASFWRARTLFKNNGLPYTQCEVAAARVGVMSILYLVPASCMVGITFYEVSGKEKWRREPGVHPSVEVFMLKIFMNLAPGLLMGLFLVNNKACKAWKEFNRRHFKKDKASSNPGIELPNEVDITQLLTLKSNGICFSNLSSKQATKNVIAETSL